MSRLCKMLLLFLCFIVFGTNAEAIIIHPADSEIDYGTSWDNPPLNVEDIIGGYDLTLVNGLDDEIETWIGKGAVTIIMEELAGFRDNTTFGYYTDPGVGIEVEQLFTGIDGPDAATSFTLDSVAEFGFYISPNGVDADRMYTEHLLNTDDDYQVAIFKYNDFDNKYILGWEDLDLNGSTGGDRDYQDMIVSIEINPAAPVPEPATMILFGAGLIGLAGFRKKNKN